MDLIYTSEGEVKLGDERVGCIVKLYIDGTLSLLDEEDEVILSYSMHDGMSPS